MNYVDWRFSGGPLNCWKFRRIKIALNHKHLAGLSVKFTDTNVMENLYKTNWIDTKSC